MTPPENGTKAVLDHLQQRVERLQQEKASAEALAYTVEDVREIKQALQSVERTISGRAKERFAEREADARERYAEREVAARERKRDRQWTVGAVMFATSLVIAAMAILLPTLSGGG